MTGTLAATNGGPEAAAENDDRLVVYEEKLKPVARGPSRKGPEASVSAYLYTLHRNTSDASDIFSEFWPRARTGECRERKREGARAAELCIETAATKASPRTGGPSSCARPRAESILLWKKEQKLNTDQQLDNSFF